MINQHRSGHNDLERRMTSKQGFLSAIAAAALSIAASGIPASAATEDEPVEPTVQAEQMASPKWRLPNAQLSPSQLSRLGSLADRCRPVTEYAQLGEFDDEALNFLRRGCR